MKPSLTRTIIIDDEADARSIIRTFLHQLCPNIELAGEASSVSEALQLIQQSRPDLIFLDVQMQDGTGFDLLDQFPQPNFQIIFITSFDEYAIKAFKYCALDYLLKPINADDFLQAVEKVDLKLQQERLFHLMEVIRQPASKRSFEKLALPTFEGLIFVDLEKILRLESDKGYTTFHLNNGKKYTVAKAIGEYEKMLDEETFFRIHVSHIINLNCVEKYIKTEGGKVKLENGVELPIARRRKEDFLNLLK